MNRMNIGTRVNWRPLTAALSFLLAVLLAPLNAFCQEARGESFFTENLSPGVNRTLDDVFLRLPAFDTGSSLDNLRAIEGQPGSFGFALANMIAFYERTENGPSEAVSLIRDDVADMVLIVIAGEDVADRVTTWPDVRRLSGKLRFAVEGPGTDGGVTFSLLQATNSLFDQSRVTHYRSQAAVVDAIASGEADVGFLVVAPIPHSDIFRAIESAKLQTVSVIDRTLLNLGLNGRPIYRVRKVELVPNQIIGYLSSYVQEANVLITMSTPVVYIAGNPQRLAADTYERSDQEDAISLIADAAREDLLSADLQPLFRDQTAAPKPVAAATFVEGYGPPFWVMAGDALFDSDLLTSVVAGGALLSVFLATGGAAVGAAKLGFKIGANIGASAAKLGAVLFGGGSEITVTGPAVLGGGTLASAGFGMAGGAFVVAALTGIGSGIGTIALTEPASVVTENFQQEPFKKYALLTLPLAPLGTVESVVLIEEIDRLEQRYLQSETEEDWERIRLEMDAVLDRLRRTLAFSDLALRAYPNRQTVFDVINRGILRFNTGHIFAADRDFALALEYAKNGSLLQYYRSLVSLAIGDYEMAEDRLSDAIRLEPMALQPYFLFVYSLRDRGEFAKARMIADLGLRNLGDNFHLARLAGDVTSAQGQFLEAAEYFEQAYYEVDEALVESETAFLCALAYRQAGRAEDADAWYATALEKAEDFPDYRDAMAQQWRNQ